MLDSNENTRISADECLKHPFFTQNNLISRSQPINRQLINVKSQKNSIAIDKDPELIIDASSYLKEQGKQKSKLRNSIHR